MKLSYLYGLNKLASGLFCKKLSKNDRLFLLYNLSLYI
ncbi:hypothetical protein appser11_6970 [Actinobacillus pleuropneumoniae serovar 11 str. 56153]|uniref:Uncharacterized protein n=1 Tax=Actinobacillus pleuropneumoniae serovar 6 str. Femo TaxID=754256 RepID=A0A828PWA2_ACTPL|nr:hypothetical protein appser2_5950 [Actinobacillus pleuropneumoniae serovar 2 str. S1536]EFM90212.1 hypothetical protein appser4_6300 [Actinobacillus pleuropneumoniae serovar 4 str. M62]EFM92340.1 hypothetical protein appser6_6980 [Actinobacillus pleuropneumoniae serovar 6 str. Femo]EFM94539.1 hypothetical protein appser9_6880 [Actinobacillus pleuropneumoniae serovar 9 str. CVJ13261]EFM96604.1 hypothetical protein appser10_6550 [Actinobacillus pleuropneumoniae serovar 10 str. D13039]EFM98781